MTLTADFQEAQARARRFKRTPATDELLALYSLYKQATAGDVQGPRPGMLEPKARAKYDAWAGRRGLPADRAQQEYGELVARLAAKYE